MVYEHEKPKNWPGWSEQDRARVTALAAKNRLEPYERGELAALRMRGDEAQQRQVVAILERGDRHADAAALRLVRDTLAGRDWS